MIDRIANARGNLVVKRERDGYASRHHHQDKTASRGTFPPECVAWKFVGLPLLRQYNNSVGERHERPRINVTIFGLITDGEVFLQGKLGIYWGNLVGPDCISKTPR